MFSWIGLVLFALVAMPFGNAEPETEEAPAPRRAPAAPPEEASSKIDDIPDLCQTDPEGGFAGDGSEFCAPVSVSNSLIWLSRNGFPKFDPTGEGDKAAQIAMVHTLSSADYLNTNVGSGTNPAMILNGVAAYIAGCGYEAVSLEYEGWRPAPEEYRKGEQKVDLRWLREGIDRPGGAVWLNLGWYKYDSETDSYVRNGGHWVTLVGYGVNAAGDSDPEALIIHNPFSRTGNGFSNDVVYAKPIESGTLTATTRQTGLPRDADGYYEITGVLPDSSSYIGILDDAIVLNMGKADE